MRSKSLSRQRLTLQAPEDIHGSLLKFKEAHPDSARVGFLMMHFGVTSTKDPIVAAIKQALSRRGFDALRADEKYYHDNLSQNVKTLMWGCGFGIAVFENATDLETNPNVFFEIGYMMALQKPVCLLKQQTLGNLPSDLELRLTYNFDTQDLLGSVSRKLEQFVSDRRLVSVS